MPIIADKKDHFRCMLYLNGILTGAIVAQNELLACHHTGVTFWDLNKRRMHPSVAYPFASRTSLNNALRATTTTTISKRNCAPRMAAKGSALTSLRDGRLEYARCGSYSLHVTVHKSECYVYICCPLG